MARALVRPLLTRDTAFHDIRARQLIAPALPWAPPPPQRDDPALPLYLPVSRTYGSRRVKPDLAVRPLITSGKFTVVKTFGPGPLQVSDLWLGDQLLLPDRLKAGLNRRNPVGSGQGTFDYELLEGRGTDGGLSLFPQALDSQEFAITVPLYTGTSWSKQSTTRLTPDGTTRLKVKFYFPTGLSERVRVNGVYRQRGVTARVQVAYRPKGSTRGIETYFTSPNIKGADDTVPFPVEYEFDLPEAKSWEVGAAVTFFSDGRSTSDVQWTRLESKSPNKAGVLLGYAAIAIQGNLADFGNDPYLQALSAGVVPELKETVGGSAVATRSPAAAFIDVLQGSANPRAAADARMHAASISAWKDDCASRGFSFDFTFGQNGTPGSVADALRTICAAGRASFALIDGKFGVVMEPSPAATPSLFFCPRTVWGFRPVRSFAPQPHAVRVTYEKAVAAYYYHPKSAPTTTLTAYQYRRETVIVYAPGYTAANATLFESWQLDGVVDQAQAVNLVYYHLAVLAARVRTYEFFTDAAQLRATRGDVALGAHDVPGWGTSWGRVKAVLSATQLQLDERVVMVAAGSYEVTLVRADGTKAVVGVTTAAGETDTITTSAPHGAAAGDLVFFGTTGQSTKSCIVLKVEPGPDLSAKVTVAELGSSLDSASPTSTKASINKSSTLSTPSIESSDSKGAVSLVLGNAGSFA